MSSSKSKKKTKSAKIPEPIKIKKEDDHLMYPMEHYVDDRVELIRQIFSSLKPKTITNLAPEFLKKSKLEEIQEQCLNEILGISKKRLLSIINSTKCPTDTETSSDDDVNSITEHISLEEISSDSDIAEPKVSKGSKILGKKKSIKNENENSKKKQKDKNEDDSNKQFSVLELLELQARARAIRSQLALEPVTKIEVDTDSSNESETKKNTASVETSSRKKPEKAANGKSKINLPKKPAATSTLTVIKPNIETVPVPAKRIKLKRNFRKQTRNEDSMDDDNKETVDTSKLTEKIVPKKEERSPSPDVIPIIAVPETLCISDSEEEKATAEKKSKLKEVENRSEHLEILSVVNIEAPKKLESLSEQNDEIHERTDASVNAPIIEAEEGEIVEEKEEDVKKHQQSKSEGIKCQESLTVEKQLSEKADEPKEILNDESKESIEDEESKNSIEKVNSKTNVNEAYNVESEDDDNDDVISLEGIDLMNEMKEHMEDDVEETKGVEDVICLDDSSEEETNFKKKSESWSDRWLNSRRVSKVLATSRLGNRVRNKIKETKKAKKLEDEAAASEKEKEKAQEVIFTSKHEMGSVDQYKEILENNPKKTD